MKQKRFGSHVMLVLALAAAQMIASAETTPNLEGVWLATVTNRDCQTGSALNVPPFRALYMFSHNGSLTTEAAFLTPSPRRSSGLGTWQHAQAHTYTSKFWFFRYNADGSFLSMRVVTLTIELDRDEFTTADKFEEFDANNKLIAVGCATSTATRAQ